MKVSARFFAGYPLLLLVALLVLAVVPISAFEAHVVNVTAVIENRSLCDARPPEWWAHNEGCFAGSGESVWADELHTLTNSYSGVFGSISAKDICRAILISNCFATDFRETEACKARAALIVDELNVVSGHTDLSALIAGAYDGNPAFNLLGLSATSTVGEAIAAIENVLNNPSSTWMDLQSAAYVARRIYYFYTYLNPIASQCVYAPLPAPDSGNNGFNEFGSFNNNDTQVPPPSQQEETTPLPSLPALPAQPTLPRLPSFNTR